MFANRNSLSKSLILGRPDDLSTCAVGKRFHRLSLLGGPGRGESGSEAVAQLVAQLVPRQRESRRAAQTFQVLAASRLDGGKVLTVINADPDTPSFSAFLISPCGEESVVHHRDPRSPGRHRTGSGLGAMTCGRSPTSRSTASRRRSSGCASGRTSRLRSH
jgi:hypothetical protein